MCVLLFGSFDLNFFVSVYQRQGGNIHNMHVGVKRKICELVLSYIYVFWRSNSGQV